MFFLIKQSQKSQAMTEVSRWRSVSTITHSREDVLNTLTVEKLHSDAVLLQTDDIAWDSWIRADDTNPNDCGFFSIEDTFKGRTIYV